MSRYFRFFFSAIKSIERPQYGPSIPCNKIRAISCKSFFVLQIMNCVRNIKEKMLRYDIHDIKLWPLSDFHAGILHNEAKYCEVSI